MMYFYRGALERAVFFNLLRSDLPCQTE